MSEQVKLLRTYNQWRRGEIEGSMDDLGLHPADIGKAIDAVLDDYATLQAELDNSKDEARQLRSQLTSLRSDAELGAAIEQACGELPEGYILTLDLERHGYGISLGLPDTDAVYEDSDFAGDSLAGQIRDAIDRAKALNEGFIDE